MELYNFTTQDFTNKVILSFTDGQSMALYTDENSGALVYREKKTTLFNVQHTGIYIGKDIYGYSYIVHSHIDNGRAVLDLATNFSKGNIIFEHEDECVNPPMEIVRKALQAVLSGLQYSTFIDNCQHLTSFACNNVKQSPDVGRITTSVISLGAGAYMLKSKSGFVKILGAFAIGYGMFEAVRQPYNGKQASFL